MHLARPARYMLRSPPLRSCRSIPMLSMQVSNDSVSIPDRSVDEKYVVKKSDHAIVLVCTHWIRSRTRASRARRPLDRWRPSGRERAPRGRRWACCRLLPGAWHSSALPSGASPFYEQRISIPLYWCDYRRLPYPKYAQIGQPKNTESKMKHLIIDDQLIIVRKIAVKSCTG